MGIGVLGIVGRPWHTTLKFITYVPISKILVNVQLLRVKSSIQVLDTKLVDRGDEFQEPCVRGWGANTKNIFILK